MVAGCLFRSFDELTQQLILRMATNGGTLEKREVLAAMDKQRARREGADRFDAAMANLEKLKIVTRAGFENPLYTLNATFEHRLNHYIENPFLLQGEDLPPDQPAHRDFFNLLGLLRESNDILRECRIGRLGTQLSKENFDFLRLPLGYKISILIKGFLAFKRRSRNHKILRDVLCLSLVAPGRRYKMGEKQEEIIRELESIRLVQRVGPAHFTVSEYLWNFAFADREREARLLECSVIVETNFKVYVQVPRGAQRNQNYQLIHDIMRLLVRLEHEEYNFEELIVGEIAEPKMREIFESRISVADYLSFFRGYMFGDLSIEKELGKWNKIYFLGLEGPAEERMIPNNVKQELKLWESNYRNRTAQEINFLPPGEDSDDENYYRRP